MAALKLLSQSINTALYTAAGDGKFYGLTPSGNSTMTGEVTISGNKNVGSVLTAANTLVDADGLGTLSYQWQRGSGGSYSNIAGATASTYTLVSGDASYYIKCVVSQTDGKGNGESTESLPYGLISASPVATSFIGVPDPDFGATIGNPITVAKQSKLGSWTANTPGWYYVEQGGTNVGNGYPADPKGTIPTILAAGDVLVLNGTFTGGALSIACSGTAVNPVWIINDEDGVAVDVQRSTTISGAYVMVDGINWSTIATGSIWLSHGNSSSYICIRNGTATGSGVHPGSNGAAYVPSGATGSDNTHIVLHNMSLSLFGDYTNNTNIDFHAIKPRNNIQDLWITNCNLYRNGADGVQTGEAQGVTGTDRPERIYIAGCTIYENRENSIDCKATVNCIISQNNLHSSQGLGDSGPPTEVVAHDDCDGIFVLFNDIHNTSSGVVTTGGCDNVYVIGNIFREITGASADTYYGAGVCVNMYASTNGGCYVHNNTFYHYDKGVSVPNTNTTEEITGNIFSSRNGAYYDVGIDATGGVYFTDICNYNLYDSARFYHDGVYFNGLTGLPNSFDANSIEGVAGLNNPAGLDFSLALSSDAIDAGNKGSGYALYLANIGASIEFDYAGNARPVLAADWDIGAHEY